jgi:GTPase SAR1 family protein
VNKTSINHIQRSFIVLSVFLLIVILSNSITKRSFNARSKSCLLGATMVGKTSIVSRFTGGDFDPSIKSTVGACYAAKVVEVNGEQLKL